MSKIRIVEVGPRDGLQNEHKILSISDREDFINRLLTAGVCEIEVGAFVSPKWVPQMSGSKQLIEQLIAQQNKHQALLKANHKSDKKIHFSALVPNDTGMEEAVLSGIKEVSIFTATSETFTKKNINCTIAESFARFEPVMALARKHRVRVRGYLSTCFGCPYEGEVPEKRVIELTKKLLKLGVYEVSIGDTIGIAQPEQVRSVVKKLKSSVGLKKFAMHFHDTRGMALANILMSLELGVTCFDSSTGGAGGCPYAKGASGNVATEDVVNMLHQMGHKTGIDLAKLVETSRWLGLKLEKNLPSKVAKLEKVTWP